LDISLKDKVDMTMTKKHFLSAFKLCASISNPALNSSMDGRNRRQKTRDQAPTFVSVKPAKEASPSGESPASRRPRYKDLRSERPSVDITGEKKGLAKLTEAGRVVVPPINKRLVARAAKLARAQTREAQKKKDPPSSSPSPTRTIKREAPLAPCRSCGRTDLPERFHAHPPTAKVSE